MSRPHPPVCSPECDETEMTRTPGGYRCDDCGQLFLTDFYNELS